MERHKLTKSARTLIRLKHSLAADQEINDTLPKIESSFYDAVNRGKSFKLEAFEL